jgi:allantoicase
MMKPFMELVDLASERLGGVALRASDEFFGPKENLLKAAAPVWIPDKYVDTGKWVDGWETRRRRAPDHDWCVIRLGAPGIIRGVVVDTAHFTGNFPTQCSFEASANQQEWTEVLPPSALLGDAQNAFEIDDPYRYTFLRFHIYPDGGVARLRVYGEVIPERLDEFTNLAAVENGARVIDASDMFFGSRHNLIYPGRSTGMHDGWETRRSRGDHHDWAEIDLAAHGEIQRVEIETLHFKGNSPESCSLETGEGEEILPRTKLQPHTRHVFETEVKRTAASRVRLRIYPDGGVSRLRLYGVPSEAGRATHRTRLINALTPQEARTCLFACCGSRRWADAMAGARPFSSASALASSAESVWRSLSREDWLEAFSAHPRIGEFTRDQRAAAEQAGALSAPAMILDELARRNREYEAKFGYIYIVCASGKSAGELLELLRARLSNDPAKEIGVAAEEQLAIVRLRLRNIGL